MRNVFIKILSWYILASLSFVFDFIPPPFSLPLILFCLTSVHVLISFHGYEMWVIGTSSLQCDPSMYCLYSQTWQRDSHLGERICFSVQFGSISSRLHIQQICGIPGQSKLPVSGIIVMQLLNDSSQTVWFVELWLHAFSEHWLICTQISNKIRL